MHKNDMFVKCGSFSSMKVEDMFFGKRMAVVTMAFGIFVSGAMSMPGDGILKEINARLGNKIISSSTINSDHIKNNHFLGKFEDRGSFVSKQFEIIRRIVTEDIVALETDEEVLLFIKNVGLGVAPYLYKKRHAIFADVQKNFVSLFVDVMHCTITAETTPDQIQQFLLAFLQDKKNFNHKSFGFALRLFSYASSVKTLFKLIKEVTESNTFHLDDSGKYYGVREIKGNGIGLQLVQHATKCENPKKYSFLEITEKEDVTEGEVSNKFWLLNLSQQGNLPNFLRRFVTTYGLFESMIKYTNGGTTMIEFMTSSPIPVVQYCYILSKGWQSYSTLGIDYLPRSRFCTFAISGKPKKIVSVYMISPCVFLNKRNPFEGLQNCLQEGIGIESIPQDFSRGCLRTRRELLPLDFDTIDQQGIHIFDCYLEDQTNATAIDDFFKQIEKVFPPHPVTRENFRTLLGDEQNQTLTDAVDQLFGYIDGSADIQLFFGSGNRGYTTQHMRNHLRRMVDILAAVIGGDDVAVRRNVIESLVENIQFNGGCAQGYRNRLYAILVALLQ